MRIPASVMDSDASDAERAQFEQVQSENQQTLDDIERDIADAKGQTYDSDPFDGAGAADVKARRQARLEYHEGDWKPEPDDPIENYSGPRHGSDATNFDELHAHAVYREHLARERWPDFDEIVDKWVAPHFRDPKTGQWLVSQEEMREFFQQDDFPRKAYLFGKKEQKKFQSRAPTQEEMDRMDPEELRARLEEFSNSAMSRGDEDDDGEPFITRTEKRAMNRLNDAASFEKYLDKIKARGR